MVTSGKRGKKAWKRMVSYPSPDDPQIFNLGYVALFSTLIGPYNHYIF